MLLIFLLGNIILLFGFSGDVWAEFDCRGQYFGKVQCEYKNQNKSTGNCQLNPKLGEIRPNSPNYWKWSWCEGNADNNDPMSNSCVPASQNVDGCQANGSNSRQCTREYYQKVGECGQGQASYNKFACTCFYKEDVYSCGGVNRAVYSLLNMPGAGGTSTFSYYNGQPTCYDTSVEAENGSWAFINESQCRAWCEGK